MVPLFRIRTGSTVFGKSFPPTGDSQATRTMSMRRNLGNWGHRGKFTPTSGLSSQKSEAEGVPGGALERAVPVPGMQSRATELGSEGHLLGGVESCG